jgi:hypothetical protein
MISWFVDKFRGAAIQSATSRLNAVGAAIVEEARRLVPVDTGHLKSTIDYTYRQDTMTVQIHADAYYAIFVEYGGRHTAPQPFLRPALMAAPRFWSSVGPIEMQFQVLATPGGRRARSFVESMNTASVQSHVRVRER